MNTDLYQEVYSYLKRAATNYPSGIPSRMLERFIEPEKSAKFDFLILSAELPQGADLAEQLLENIISRALPCSRESVLVRFLKAGSTDSRDQIVELISSNRVGLSIIFGDKLHAISPLGQPDQQFKTQFLELGGARCLFTYSLEELVCDIDKKREFWNSLRNEISTVPTNKKSQ